jgi:UDP-N-acetylmuramoylalanine--D-glutamate ligase
MNLSGKHVIVLGLGASGVSAARLCLRRGAKVTAVDAKKREGLSEDAIALEEQGALLLSGSNEANFDAADLVVISPGVPSFPALERTRTKIIGEVELACSQLKHPAPIVAVGGTNGKSTTTTLVGELLSAAGKKVFVGGNLGEPLADHADEKFDVIVLEVSSFQMERIETFHPKVAVLLNITPDHLDRYPDFDAYARAKGNCFLNQTPDDLAVIPAGDALCLREARRGKARIVTFGPGGDRVVEPSALRIRGGHNALNAAAAVAAVDPFDVSGETIAKVFSSFEGLPHRMVMVAEIDGVRFYDDSKGTNVGAAVTALETLLEPKAVLIAGGRDKGGSYAPLVDALEKKGRALVVIGEAADRIASAAEGKIPIHRAKTMDEAVALAARAARPGDAVLLSPACSSFDMFEDYKDRGRAFVRAIRARVP